MRAFDYYNLKTRELDDSIVNCLSFIHEEKGKEEIYLKQLPKELGELVQITKIQSTDSSNEIEGIRTSSTRLRQIVNMKTSPKRVMSRMPCSSDRYYRY